MYYKLLKIILLKFYSPALFAQMDDILISVLEKIDGVGPVDNRPSTD